MLALPEGKAPSAKALMTFAQLDGRNRLLGGKAVAFDMRASDRIYFRMPSRTDATEQASVAATQSPVTTATAAPVASSAAKASAPAKPAKKDKN